ncbi:MAG: ABC transporter ATP-binding protein [Bryobacteraceae bacterium]
MSKVISVEEVSKSYRLGMIGGATLKEDFSRWWARIRGQPDPLAMVGDEHHARRIGEQFWALQEVNFSVNKGEVLGIIGRNGAGKSTLLKILSQVTAPSSGEIRVKGRIASLLEVGTGFHPELTGRENIFLNGAILGMTRNEIRRKFDEIVDFSGIEQFVETPVKRYSSGMYVRLAFAVAAHLEPEILVVDEVLAVGDAEFQEKCLGKMRTVADQGRTIIFVSHNLNAVTALCRNAITLEAGRLVDSGPADVQVSRYLSKLRNVSQLTLREREDRDGDGSVRITEVSFYDSFDHEVEHLFSGATTKIILRYVATRLGVSPVVALSCFTSNGEKVFHIDNNMSSVALSPTVANGQYECSIPKLPLPPGRYQFNALVKVGEVIADDVYGAATMNVLPADYYGTGRAPSANGGLIFAEHIWSHN